MNSLKNRFILTLLVSSLLNIGYAKPQCGTTNIPFQSGEKLNYDLYVKLGFISKKGGFASLKTQLAKYNGKDAYRMDLISETQGVARKLFEMNDTLTSYTGKNLVPLAYVKDAHEGGDYTKERLYYTYPENSTVKINAVRHKNGEFKFNQNIEAPGCTYDLVSVLFFCRTLDYSKMKTNEETVVNFISGQNRGHMRIVYNGKEIVKANDGSNYNTIKLTLYISDKAFDNGKEAMKVYISDDNNRIPVSLETKLKFGSTKAVLTGYSGNKYPLNVVKKNN